MIHKEIEELINKRNEQRQSLAKIEQRAVGNIYINNHLYKIITDKLEAFNFFDFSNKFNPIFNKYDYIVGDWGYGQLRLKGFYNEFRKVNKACKFSSINDYLTEKCNLGAPYFILCNIDFNNSTNAQTKKSLNNTKKKYVDKESLKGADVVSTYKEGSHQGFKIIQKNKTE